MNDPRLLTTEEIECLNCITDAWNKFLHLPRCHPDELSEFRAKTHDLQRMILVRQSLEKIGPLRPQR